MKKLLALSLIGSSLILSSNPAKADYDAFAYQTASDGSYNLYGINYTTGGKILLTNRIIVGNTIQSVAVSSNTGEVIFKNGSNYYEAYNWETNSWRTLEIPEPTSGSNFSSFIERPSSAGGPSDSSLVLSNDGDDELLRIKTDEISSGGDSNTTLIKKNTDGTIQIGTDENDIDITSEGLAIDGDPLITKKANGELHIGKNSWITKEENGRQKVYAKDANGNPIPIDYTNGTKLLINGRDVEQSINNVGALSAALTGLPTVPTDTTLACGFGTGTHGGDFAFSGGCASKVNEKLSINYAASMTMPNQDYAGDFEDKFSARAGFVWKLGKTTKPTQISMNEKRVFEAKIKTLEDKNNQLLARLEILEKVALGDLQSKDLAVYKLQ